MRTIFGPMSRRKGHNLCLILIAMIAAISVFGQSEYRYDGSRGEGLPDWALLMYSDDADPGDVVQLYEEYYARSPLVKNQHTQYYKRWLREIARRQSTNGRTPLDTRYLARRDRLTAQSRSEDLWQSIGPWDWDHDAADRSYAPGAAHVYTVQQSLSDPDVLYAGTATAGLWRSLDRGLSWTNATADLPMGGLTALEIDLGDADVVYAGIMSSIYKTTDGGMSWSTTGDPAFQALELSTADIVMHPTNHEAVWACTNGGLFSTEDGGTTWTLELTGEFQELEFHPTDHDTIYVVKYISDKTEFYRSVDGGSSFQLQSSGWPDPDTGADEHQRRTEIAVTPADPDLVVALATGSANGGSGLYGIYISADAGATWTFQCCGPQPAGPPSTENMNLMGWSDQGTDDGGQYYYDLALDISPTNADSIFVAGVNLWVSADGGSSFVCPAKWSHSYKPNYVHADIHDVRYMSETREIWIACDGGIFYSNDNGANFERRMQGINGTDFWGFGAGRRDPNVMLGGTYHNGTLLKDDTVYINNWISTDGGDNYRGFVHPNLDRQAFSDYNIKELSGDRTINNSTRSFQNKPNASYIIGRSSDILFHPHYYNTWLTGSGTSLWRTVDNGYSFSQVHDFGVDVAAMDICMADPDAIYVTTFPDWWAEKTIWRTLDGGLTWTEITPPSGQLNGNLWVPYDVVVSALDPLVVWIVRTSMYGGTNLNGAVIFESIDGGETWENITFDFPVDEAPTCITGIYGSEELYVGTRRAVYYKDPVTDSWELWSAGLPAWTQSTRLIPDYQNGVLRNATNRSVWERQLETTLAPIALASVSSETIYCLEDTVYFKDNSIMQSAGATWSWSFPGGNPESSTERDPKVLYTYEGVYDVSLVVWDVNGTDTFHFEKMVKVLDKCKVDGYPGKALIAIANPNHALVPDIGQTVDSFTVMAWIKPNGIQNNYAAVLMNDGTAGGLNFRESNNTLGYHWPGGQWWWDSGLVAPSGVWSHVAMVVTPSQVRIYLNGIEAVHNIATDPLELTTMRIGSYQGWGDRNYSGVIDELSMFDRALTRDEIRSLRHLTLTGEEEGLLTYYQFNSDGPSIIDKANDHDASLYGGAFKSRSRAPVGEGTSELKNITTPGEYDYSGIGMTLNFEAGSITPGGDLWISRLGVDPDTMGAVENKLNRGYYILDNYGVNPTIRPPFTIEFDSIGFISDSMAAQLTASVVSRESNAELGDWSEVATEVDLVEGLNGSALTDNYIKLSPGQMLIKRDSFPHGQADISVGTSLPVFFRGGMSTAFDVEGDSAGLVLPTLTYGGLDSIGAPIAGMVCFLRPAGRLCFYDGDAWRLVQLELIDIEPSMLAGPERVMTMDSSMYSGGILVLGTSGALLPGTFSDDAFTNVDFPPEGSLAFRVQSGALVYYNEEEWSALKVVEDSIDALTGMPSASIPGFAIGMNHKEPGAVLQIGTEDKVMKLPGVRCEDVRSPVEGTIIYDPTRRSLCLFDGANWFLISHH